MKMKLYIKFILLLFLTIPHCFSNVVEIIGAESTLRCGVFKMQPNPKNQVLIGTAHKDKDIVLGEHTATINTILNDQNVSRRPARPDEKKTILQAVMGTIIIHGDNLAYQLIDHKLSSTDEFY